MWSRLEEGDADALRYLRRGEKLRLILSPRVLPRYIGFYSFRGFHENLASKQRTFDVHGLFRFPASLPEKP